jgi:hypothetical protein
MVVSVAKFGVSTLPGLTIMSSGTLYGPQGTPTYPQGTPRPAPTADGEDGLAASVYNSWAIVRGTVLYWYAIGGVA